MEKKSGERVKGDMWDGERRFLGVSARGTEPSEDPKPLVSFCWRDEALTLIEAHQCACLCERVHSKIHFTKITSQSVWPPICRLLLVPYLFLFHLLRIKECNPVEIGQHNGVSNKRKCLSMIFRLCVRGCVSDLGRTSRTWFDPWQLAAPLSVCQLLIHIHTHWNTHTVTLTLSLYLWQRPQRRSVIPADNSPACLQHIKTLCSECMSNVCSDCVVLASGDVCGWDGVHITLLLSSPLPDDVGWIVPRRDWSQSMFKISTLANGALWSYHKSLQCQLLI